MYYLFTNVYQIVINNFVNIKLIKLESHYSDIETVSYFEARNTIK